MARVTINLAQLEGIAEAKAEAGIRRAALQGEARMKAILSQPGSGRTYEFEFRTINGKSVPMKSMPRAGGPHTASAPGASPAPDTGQLRAATQADTNVRREGSDLVGRVVANKEYALALEKGTERMAARPFMSLLATDHKDELRTAFIEGAKQ